MTARGLMLAALLASLSASAADTAYVSDKLVVGVYATAASDGERLAQLATGDSVEVLARDLEYTQVRLADGREGWIKNSYLSVDPPAAARVPALEAELKKLQAAADKGARTNAQSTVDAKRIADLQKALDAARAALASHPKSIEPVATASDTTLEASGALAIEPIGADAAYRRKAWIWGTLVALVTFGVGFGVGWWMLDRKVRARYGGLRVY
jgi:SH3 domain protein